MLIEGVDYFIRRTDFPTCACGGAVLSNEDGTYTVLLNARLSAEQREAAARHELAHIECGHLHDDAKSVAQKEAEASGERDEKPKRRCIPRFASLDSLRNYAIKRGVLADEGDRR